MLPAGRAHRVIFVVADDKVCVSGEQVVAKHVAAAPSGQERGRPPQGGLLMVGLYRTGPRLPLLVLLSTSAQNNSRRS